MALTGVISEAVPVKKTSSARCNISRLTCSTLIGRPRSRASWRTVSRVMPTRIELASGGVQITPFHTRKMF